jgi:tRNA (guanine37-N1)-methyltransferase
MVIQVVTLFPESLTSMLSASMLRRAQARTDVEIRVVPMRLFGVGIHRQTDDYPFGGGPGMLLRADVVVPAVEWALMHHRHPATVLWTSPQGRRLDQAYCRQLALEPHVIIVAGHYEGVDERAMEILGGTEVSIGDYVLTGGELPALVIVDALTRLQPGVLGADDGADRDSFSHGVEGLEGPQYTRPEQYRGRSVPAVLLSGNHRAIESWQREQAKARTASRRPDLT